MVFSPVELPKIQGIVKENETLLLEKRTRTMDHSHITALLAATALLLNSDCRPSRIQVPAPTAWDRIERLRAGEYVEIALLGGEVIEGTVTTVDAAGIRVSADRSGSVEHVPRQTIQRIQLVQVDRADSLKNGALIGAAIGVAYILTGLTYVAVHGEGGEPPSRSWLEWPAIGAAIGAWAGMLVDALKAGKQKVTIYVR